MTVSYHPGQVLQQGDLFINFVDGNNSPTNVYEISYDLYFVDPGPPETEVLIPPAGRTPVNSSIGHYYASLMIPPSAQLGKYRIRWTFQEASGSATAEAVQEFQVESPDTQVVTMNRVEADMVRQLRMFLRDHHPDRNYRFCPPEHEGRIGKFNRVFGQIWEDEELLQYLKWALYEWNSFAPRTSNLCTLNSLLRFEPNWQTFILWGAAAHALFALSVNWIHDEFSVAGDTPVTVYLPSGEEVSLPIEELYGLFVESQEDTGA